MRNGRIQRAKRLEEQLKEYPIHSSMVPKKTWWFNPRKLLRKEKWDQIRRATYRKANYKCEFCEKKNITLHCHEHWEYNYEEAKQVLVDLIALCYECHMLQHLGMAGILSSQGKLDPIKLQTHWLNITKLSLNDYEIQTELAWEVWRLRNQFKWQVTYKNDTPITSPPDFDKLMSLTKLE